VNYSFIRAGSNNVVLCTKSSVIVFLHFYLDFFFLLVCVCWINRHHKHALSKNVMIGWP